MRLRCSTLLWIAGIAAFTGAAYGQTISTVAGGGAASGYPALNFSVAPTTIAVAANGTVYFGNFAGQVSAVYQYNPSTGDVSIVAGNNTRGYSGDGGPAINAQISTICGLALDQTDDLYIADCDSEVVRRVDAMSGTITTVAGTGSGGYNGDGIQATSATLNSPHGLTIDANGNLFIADTQNFRIRRVDATTKVITTVAGNGTAGFSGNAGSATQAELNGPEGVAVDSNDNLYIADTQNSVVRLVSNGIIGAFAGNNVAGYMGDSGPAQSAELDFPDGVWLDNNNNLYIADTLNSAIRFVSAANGNISTVAGDGIAGYTGDGLSATQAELNNPAEVAVDRSGNLYIPDQYDYVIRVVNSSGTISTIAGNGFADYGGDNAPAPGAQLFQPMGAVAIDASGNILIPDTSNQVVRQVAASTGIITTIAGTGVAGYSGDGGLATSAELSSPEAVALDAAGNIFIADAGNNVIRRIDHSAGTITTFAGDSTCGFTGDGGPPTSAELCFPGGIVFDAAGDLYIADTYSNAIRFVSASTGKITTVAGIPSAMGAYSGDGGPATSAQFNIPNSIALDGAGNLYIADTYNVVIREVFASNGVIETVAGDHTIGYSGDGGPATAATMYRPFGVTVDSAGDIYIADTYNSVVRYVDASSGKISTIAGNGVYGFAGDGGAATAAEMADTWGVTLDASGRLFISDFFNSRIRLVTAIQPSFTVKPGTLSFGNTFLKGTSSPMTVTVQNTGPNTLHFTAAVSGTPVQFSQTNNCATVQPQASCTINVTFAPTAIGAQKATLSISAGSGNPQTVALSGNGIKLAVSPTTLSFGNQLRGQASSSQTVTLSTGSVGPVSITGISTTPSQYSQTNNCGTSLAANSSCTINVVFKPTVKGALAGKLAVASNAGGYGVILSGTGVLPTVAPTKLTFGNQNRGTTSSSQTVTLTNVSVDVLSIASIAVNSAQYSQSNNCPSSLTANASCAITVVFKPGVKGAINGVLAIDTNNAGDYDVALSGTGVLPGVTPTSLTFGSQKHGTSSASKPVTITNTGNAALAITSISITAPRQFSQTNNCGTSVPSNSSCTINVVFNPTAAGNISGDLNIKTVGPGTSTVALSGTGT
jgi:sugar lactone lactonase YvrE